MTGLFQPIDIAGMSLESRLVFPPMQTKLATKDGRVTDSLIEHYVERTRGNGLLTVEHSYVSPEGKYAERQLGIHEDDVIPGLSRLVDRIHDRNTYVAIQINHCGARIDDRKVGIQPVGPSSEDGVRELEKSEIEDKVAEFVDATKRAVQAGFDAVEIHGAHGFLLNQFYSPLTNHREDYYGGSFEKRLRFPLEVVKEVRDFAEEIPILYRLGAVDLDPSGIQIEDSVRFAKLLKKNGVDLIDVSGGHCGSRPEKLEGKQGYFVPQASEIKKSIGSPVIGVGGITDPLFADKLVVDGKVDLVAVGRAQFSDPNWANKAVEQLKDENDDEKL